MTIKEPNKLRELAVRKLLGLSYRLDNSGNGDMDVSGELDFIKKIAQDYKDSIVFFDIGANVGKYTAVVKEYRHRSNDKYFLFEPQKSCFAELRKKFSSDKNIILNNFGLSDTKSESIIYKDSEKSGLTSLYKRNLDFYKLKMDIEEKVLLDTASNYIEKNGIHKIHLVKMDIEGNEIKVLKGFGKYLSGDFIDYIQFEYGGANIDSHTNLLDFYNLLEPKGFRICKMMKTRLERRAYDPRYENFVCQNFVAVSKKASDELLHK